MDSEDVITALEYLRRFMPEGIILIGDHAPIHTSETTVRYLRTISKSASSDRRMYHRCDSKSAP